MDINKLAQNAKACHEAFIKSHKQALENALQAGQVLLQARKQIPNGNQQEGKGKWRAFLKSTGIPSRTAERYMYIAKYREHWPEKSATMAEIGVVGLENKIRHSRGTRKAKSNAKPKTTRKATLEKLINAWEKIFEQFGDLSQKDLEAFWRRVESDKPNFRKKAA